VRSEVRIFDLFDSMSTSALLGSGDRFLAEAVEFFLNRDCPERHRYPSVGFNSDDVSPVTLTREAMRRITLHLLERHPRR
jgi:hypothetical protein